MDSSAIFAGAVARREEEIMGALITRALVIPAADLTQELEIFFNSTRATDRPYPNCGVARCSTSMKWPDSTRLDPNANKADGNIVRERAPRQFYKWLHEY